MGDREALVGVGWVVVGVLDVWNRVGCREGDIAIAVVGSSVNRSGSVDGSTVGIVVSISLDG